MHQGQRSHQPTGMPTMPLASNAMPTTCGWQLTWPNCRLAAVLPMQPREHKWLNLPVHRLLPDASCTGLIACSCHATLGPALVCNQACLGSCAVALRPFLQRAKHSRQGSLLGARSPLATPNEPAAILLAAVVPTGQASRCSQRGCSRIPCYVCLQRRLP